MPLSAQQLAAQKNLSYVLAEKLAQRILKGEYEPGTILPGEIGAASLPTGSKGWHRGTEGASQYVNGRNGGIKRELSP